MDFNIINKRKQIIKNIANSIVLPTSDTIEKGGKLGQEGEIREWNGKKYKKTGGKWIPVTDPKEKKTDDETGKQPGGDDNQPSVTKQDVAQLTLLKQKLQSGDIDAAHEIYNELHPAAQDKVPQDVVNKLVEHQHSTAGKDDVDFDKLGEDKSDEKPTDGKKDDTKNPSDDEKKAAEVEGLKEKFVRAKRKWNVANADKDEKAMQQAAKILDETHQKLVDAGVQKKSDSKFWDKKGDKADESQSKVIDSKDVSAISDFQPGVSVKADQRLGKHFNNSTVTTSTGETLTRPYSNNQSLMKKIKALPDGTKVTSEGVVNVMQQVNGKWTMVPKKHKLEMVVRKKGRSTFLDVKNVELTDKDEKRQPKEVTPENIKDVVKSDEKIKDETNKVLNDLDDDVWRFSDGDLDDYMEEGALSESPVLDDIEKLSEKVAKKMGVDDDDKINDIKNHLIDWMFDVMKGGNDDTDNKPSPGIQNTIDEIDDMMSDGSLDYDDVIDDYTTNDKVDGKIQDEVLNGDAKRLDVTGFDDDTAIYLASDGNAYIANPDSGLVAKLKESNIKKAIKTFTAEETLIKAYPVGTIRQWKGKKYQKQGDGKWKPVKDGGSGKKDEKKDESAIKLNDNGDGTYTWHSGGGSTLKSKPGESVSDFKKRIKQWKSGDKKPSFTDILDNPKSKKLIEAIEGLDKNNIDHHELYKDLVEQLKSKFNYDYKDDEWDKKINEKKGKKSPKLFNLVRDWVGDYSDDEIKSVVDSLKDAGLENRDFKIKKTINWSQAKESDAIQGLAQTITSNIKEGSWHKNLSKDDVVDIVEGLVRAKTTNNENIFDDKVSKAFELLGIEKARTIHPIGTIKKFGGRQYIKTSSGWKYYGKGTGQKAQQHRQASKSDEKTAASMSRDELTEYAKKNGVYYTDTMKSSTLRNLVSDHMKNKQKYSINELKTALDRAASDKHDIPYATEQEIKKLKEKYPDKAAEIDADAKKLHEQEKASFEKRDEKQRKIDDIKNQIKEIERKLTDLTPNKSLRKYHRRMRSGLIEKKANLKKKLESLQRSKSSNQMTKDMMNVRRQYVERSVKQIQTPQGKTVFSYRDKDRNYHYSTTNQTKEQFIQSLIQNRIVKVI